MIQRNLISRQSRLNTVRPFRLYSVRNSVDLRNYPTVAALQDTSMWTAKSSERKVFDEILQLETLAGAFDIWQVRRKSSN